MTVIVSGGDISRIDQMTVDDIAMMIDIIAVMTVVVSVTMVTEVVGLMAVLKVTMIISRRQR
jgi:hypothetical protein